MDLEEQFLDAARYGDLQEVKRLCCSNGVNPDCRDENGTTALHRAAANDHVDVCEYLVTTCGLSANSKNKSGNTALHWAVITKSLTTVDLLTKICRDLDILSKNDSGQSPFSESCRLGLEDIQYSLLRYKGKKGVGVGSSGLIGSYESDELGAAESESGSESEPERKRMNENREEGRLFVFGGINVYCKEGDSNGIENPIGDYDRSGNDTDETQNKENNKNVDQWDTAEYNNDESTGNSIWSSSVIGSHWMAQLAQQNFFVNKVTLEMGSGCGLLGLTAALSTLSMSTRTPDTTLHDDSSCPKSETSTCTPTCPTIGTVKSLDVRTLNAGGSSLTRFVFSDNDDIALRGLIENIELNRMYGKKATHRIDILSESCGSDSVGLGVSPMTMAVAKRYTSTDKRFILDVSQLDWMECCAGELRDDGMSGIETFDVIIGSDLVFDDPSTSSSQVAANAEVHPLAKTVSILLSKPNGQFLYAYQQHSCGVDRFLASLQCLGLSYMSVEIPPECRRNCQPRLSEKQFRLKFPALETEDFRLLRLTWTNNTQLGDR